MKTIKFSYHDTDSVYADGTLPVERPQDDDQLCMQVSQWRHIWASRLVEKGFITGFGDLLTNNTVQVRRCATHTSEGSHADAREVQRRHVKLGLTHDAQSITASCNHCQHVSIPR
jgi:hypothetical protein